MSGILGILHLDGRAVDRLALAHLSAAQRHRGPLEGIRTDGATGLACRVTRIAPESIAETQPVVDVGGAMIVFDGRLDNREELLGALAPDASVSRQSPDAVLALAAYRSFGEDFPGRLNGDFALGLYDPHHRHLLLARDAVGVRPLYYHRTRELFLFASDIKTLLSHPGVESRPDDDTLADFLFGRFAGQGPHEQTFFQNIVSVLPGHLVVASRDGIRTRRYWDFDPTRRLRFPRGADYTDAFKEVFERAVQRRLRSMAPVAVSVSGGLDSSAIFCVAGTLLRGGGNHPPELLGVSSTFSSGSPADEASFLADIERATGLAISRLEDLPAGITDAASEGVWHGEAPFLDPQWSATHAQLSEVRRRGAEVLLTGHWGDQFLVDDAYLVDLCRCGAWLTVSRHLATHGRWLDIRTGECRRRLLTALLKYHAPDVMVSALRRMRNRLRPRPEWRPWYTGTFRRRASRPSRPRAEAPPSTGAHASSIYREVRARYAVFCMEWNNKIAAMHGLEMAFPFLDRDLIAFLMAIPGEVQSRNGVPKGILREALGGVLPEAIAVRRSKADFTAVVNAGLSKDREIVARSLQADGMTAARGYVRGDTLTEITSRRAGIDAPTAESMWAVGDLYALELWLRQFPGSTVVVSGG